MPSFQRFLQPKFLFALVLGFYFLFGLHHLTQFLTADEHYWIYERIPQYWNAWETGKLRKTFINDKPGVSLAIVSGPALLFFPHPEKYCADSSDRLLECDVDTSEHLLLTFRLPLLIVNGLLLIFLFWIIGRLTNPWIALWSTSLMALSPTLIGISQIVNPDALLWSFGGAALFSFFALLKYGERKYLFLTILFTAFALLTKYVALALLPFYFFLILVHFLARPDIKEEVAFSEFKKDLRALFFVLLGTLVLFLIALPAFALNLGTSFNYFATVPDKGRLILFGSLLLAFFFADFFLLKGHFLTLFRRFLLKNFSWLRALGGFFLLLFLFVLLGHFLFPHWSIYVLPFDLKDLSDARYHARVPNIFEAFFLEWNPIVFSLTPIAILALLALWIENIRRTWHTFYYFSLSLGFFFIFFAILLVYSNVLAVPRYVILLFPLFSFLGGIGIWHLGQWLRFEKSIQKVYLTLFLVAGSLPSLFTIQPFYFDYANFLLPKKYLVQDGWGLGGYEAAQYLNTLPGAKDLTVWSDYYGFCEFFIGKCLTAYTFDGTHIKPDYYVLSRRGQIRYMSRYTRWERLSGLTAYKYYDRPNPDWSLIIDGRRENFVKVFKVEK